MTVDNGAVLDMNGFDNEVNTLSGLGTVENSAAGTSVWLGVGNDATGSEFDGTLTDAGGGTGQLGFAKLAQIPSRLPELTPSRAQPSWRAGFWT